MEHDLPPNPSPAEEVYRTLNLDRWRVALQSFDGTNSVHVYTYVREPNVWTYSIEVVNGVPNCVIRKNGFIVSNYTTEHLK
jgi:hypothetical protein